MLRDHKSFDGTLDDDEIFMNKAHYYSLEPLHPDTEKPPPRTKTKGSSSSVSTVNLKLDKVYRSTHQGFLTKQGGSIKNWKKRFFTLRSNNVLYYYRDINKDPQGGVDLNEGGVNVRFGVAEDTCYVGKVPLDRTIVIDTIGRKYYLYSETVGEANKWLEVLCGLIKQPLEQKKSFTLPAHLRSMTMGEFQAEIPQPLSSPQSHLKSKNQKLRANTVSARFQDLPAVPIRTSQISDDVEQFYGELPVHQRMLAEMRAKVNEADINYYSGILDLDLGKKDLPIYKRRSDLYKCRSVEYLSSSSGCEVSDFMEVKRSGIPSLPLEATYSTAGCHKSEDELYGLTITIPDTKVETPVSPEKPQLPLPELTEYATTVQPIPASMRKSMVPHLATPEGENKTKRMSEESLGVGVYSLLNPDTESDIPIPKPRNLVTESKEGIYDDVSVDELYDEITSETRENLIDINHNQKPPEFTPHNLPDNDYEVLAGANEDASTQVVDSSFYDEVTAVTNDSFPPSPVKNNSIEIASDNDPIGSFPKLGLNSGVALSPRSIRRRKDPLPPVPLPPHSSSISSPPQLPSSPKPVLTPKAAAMKPKQPTFTLDTKDSGDYILTKPKKKSLVPDLSEPSPPDTKEDIATLLVVVENATADNDPKYAKIKKVATLDRKCSPGAEIFLKTRGNSLKDETNTSQSPASSGSSSEEVDLTEEERKLERLKREYNREEKKNERMVNDIKNQKKMDLVKKDQRKIIERIESIRSKNISMLMETGKSSEEEPQSPKPPMPLVAPPVAPPDNRTEMERLQIEKEKLELERERHQLEKEKLEIEKQKSEMERFKLEHQKLLFEREKLLFEKEKMELSLAKKST